MTPGPGTIMSLCSGYGGLDLAVEHLTGATTRWVAEVDPDPSAVLAARFPAASNIGDLKQVDWARYAGRVDILTAGYPCQPFSQAGRRKGVDDARHLWPWIAEGIRQLRPGVVVLENVRGHLRRGFDHVLGDLADLGMSARWGVVRASDAGAPHRRERLFVVAADPYRAGPWRLPSGHGAEGHMEVEPRHDLDRRHVDTATDPAGPGWVVGPGLSDSPERPGPSDGGPVDWAQFGPAIRRWEHLLGRPAPVPLAPGTKRVNAELVEWMMGLPAGWVTGVLPNNRALKVLGNGVVPQQAVLALSHLW